MNETKTAPVLQSFRSPTGSGACYTLPVTYFGLAMRPDSVLRVRNYIIEPGSGNPGSPMARPTPSPGRPSRSRCELDPPSVNDPAP